MRLPVASGSGFEERISGWETRTKYCCIPYATSAEPHNARVYLSYAFTNFFDAALFPSLSSIASSRQADAARHGAKPAVPADASHVLRQLGAFQAHELEPAVALLDEETPIKKLFMLLEMARHGGGGAASADGNIPLDRWITCMEDLAAVSYTHLTLPTILLV